MNLLSYVFPFLLLVLTMVGFLLLGRRGFRSFGIAQNVLRVVVALPLVVSGIVLHLFRTSVLADIIPPAFPAHVFLVLFSGVCEIAGAIGLFIPGFRRAAAFWIAVMMIAVFPANVFVAGKVVDGFAMPGLAVRATFQIIYLALVLLAGYGLPGRTKTRDRV